jgi:NADH-quinone oxidoreductase subunit A
MFEDYFRNYAILIIFFGVAIAVPLGMLGMSYMASFVKIRPQRTTRVKRAPYEGGMMPLGQKPSRFNFRYYYYALLFVAFDVETVLLYPWAVRHGVLSNQFGWAALGAVLVFLFVVTVGYLYAWRKKALEWQ